MSISRRGIFLLCPALLALPGCLATQNGSLEVLNPKQAYGQSLTVVSDLHRENEAIEKRLASDLQTALAKRGLTIAEDPSKADLVVVPTLGRIRERPVSPEDRPFDRYPSAYVITAADRASRRADSAPRVATAAQQAGLLLSAYRAEDYASYGAGRQSLPPVWRIYVSQPATQMKWNTVAVPLINAAAGAAKPLGKSLEQRTRSMERETKEEP
jgi:hypothetical protein